MAAQYEAGARAAAQRIMVGKESTILERARSNLSLYGLTAGESESERRERIGLHRCPIGHVLLARDAMSVLELRLGRMAKDRDRAAEHLAHRNEEAKADSCSLDEADSNIDKLTATTDMMAHEIRLLRITVVVLSILCWILWALSPRTRLGLIPLLISLLRTSLAIAFVLGAAHCIPRLPMLSAQLCPILHLCTWAAAGAPYIDQTDDTAVPAHELSPPTLSLSEKIRAFYTEHSPDKLLDPAFADRIAAKYSYPGGEGALFASLNKRYS